MRFALVGATLLCALTSTLTAQGWIDPVRPVPPNVMGRIERLRSAVQVSVTGRIARVTVEEWFRNNGPVMDEGMYHFPLPGEAVFSSYSLWQGDQELRGEAMDAAQARAIYEAIVRQKRDPALIELAGQGLIRARVFPIAPGGRARSPSNTRNCSTAPVTHGVSATSATAIARAPRAAFGSKSIALLASAIRIRPPIRSKSQGAMTAWK